MSTVSGMDRFANSKIHAKNAKRTHVKFKWVQLNLKAIQMNCQALILVQAGGMLRACVNHKRPHEDDMMSHFEGNGSINAKEFIKRRNRTVWLTTKISLLCIKLFCFGLLYLALYLLVNFHGWNSLIYHIWAQVCSKCAYDCLEHGFPSKTFYIINGDSSNDSSIKHCKRCLWFSWKGCTIMCNWQRE